MADGFAVYYSQPFCIRADGVPAYRRIFFPQQTNYQQISSNINKYQKNARKTAARFCCVPAAFPTFPLRKRSGLIQNSDKLHTLLSPFFSFTRFFRTIPAFFITIPAAFQRITRKNIAFSGFFAIFGRTAPEIPAKIFIFAGTVRRKGYFL